MSTDKAAITTVFEHILTAFKNDSQGAGEFLAASPAMASAIEAREEHNPEDFWLRTCYPLDNALGAVVSANIADATRRSPIEFLYLHHDFLDAHLSQLFSTLEGHACSADKSRTVLSSLAHFFATGVAHEFNYEQKYTFHLPRRILRTHEERLAFYEALVSLYYGNPAKYLAQYHLMLSLGQTPTS